MEIRVKTTPHNQQPYPTVGFWRWLSREELEITVSEEVGNDSAFLVALHEAFEAYKCQKNGITTEQVDAFDIAYEKAHRVDGKLDGPRLDDSEPGNDPEAPYFVEHQQATALEVSAAAMLGVDWKEHTALVESLP